MPGEEQSAAIVIRNTAGGLSVISPVRHAKGAGIVNPGVLKTGGTALARHDEAAQLSPGQDLRRAGEYSEGVRPHALFIHPLTRSSVDATRRNDLH